MFKTQNLYQNDKKWNDTKLGNSSETIGEWGGLLTSITMMLNGIGYNETPESVNEKMKKESGFLRALPIPSLLSYVWPNCIYCGMDRCEKSSAPIEKINARTANQRIVVAFTAQRILADAAEKSVITDATEKSVITDATEEGIVTLIS